MANNLLLSSDSDLIVIELNYQVKANKHGQRQFKVLTDKEVAEFPELKEGEDSPFETLVTKWRPQTWQTNNSLLKNSMTYNNVSGNSELDWSSYQQNVFKYCLAEWDVTDDQGNPVPPTLENVGMLPSIIARALIQRYDEALMIDDEEKKE
jgi:hypothetical protein